MGEDVRTLLGMGAPEACGSAAAASGSVALPMPRVRRESVPAPGPPDAEPTARHV